MTGSAVPPGVIADAVAAAAIYLRLAAGEADEVLTRAAASAIALGEAYLGVAIVQRPFEDIIDSPDGYRLPSPLVSGWSPEDIVRPRSWRLLDARPVAAITGMTALPSGAAPFVLPVDAYAIDIDGDGDGWVRIDRHKAPPRVAVAYTAGLGAAWADVPAAVAQGVVALAAHLYEARASDAAPPAAVAALWRPYRRVRIGAEAMR